MFKKFSPLFLFFFINDDSADRSKIWHRLISLLLIGLCAAMIALGVFVFLDNLQVQDFAEWFIGGYMILFALLLLSYELMWWCTIPSLNRVIRKNFGFIYKVNGKALYLIFVACLCIGIDNNLLGDMDWLRWFSGIGWGGTGILLIVLGCARPTMFADYHVPTSVFNTPNPSEAV